MKELKPCPFCGSKSLDYEIERTANMYMPSPIEPWIRPTCHNIFIFKCVCGCKFKVDAFNRKEAIEAWNHRYYESEDEK